MSVVVMHRNFERYAFECAIRANPVCEASGLAFVDWLCEQGYTMIGARRILAKLRREVIEQRELDRLWQWIGSSIGNDQKARSIIMRRCNTHFLTVPEIQYVRGNLHPRWARVPGRFVALDGIEYGEGTHEISRTTEVRFVPTSETVTVGAGWVLRILFPPSKFPKA